MDKLFLSILNMSLNGAFVITAICLARLPLRKAPKLISYALWMVAGFRLVFPFSIESVFSLIPFNAEPIPSDIAMQPVPRINSGIPILNNAVSGALPVAEVADSANPLQIWMDIGAYVWIFGVAVMVIYGAVSFFVLKRKLKNAVCVESNIYETENLKSPFVLGILRPVIYLPAGLSAREREYILLHEQTHIRRYDHIVNFAAYFILCLHWFNPLAWAAFLLMGADMEMSCDERVMKETDGDIRDDYSMSLVRIATGRRGTDGGQDAWPSGLTRSPASVVRPSPLAFGENGMKERVKRVLNFSKPSRVIIVMAVVLAAVLSVGFAVNRINDGNPSNWAIYTFPNENSDLVFFQCNDTPYNPDYTVISAQLMNNRGLSDLKCGEQFTLVKQIGKVWKIVPFADGTGFNDVAWFIENGMSFGYSIRPEMFAFKLGEGNYRIVVNALWYGAEPRETLTVWADFTIDGNAPKQEINHIPDGWLGNFDGKDMTLDDVRELAAKGDELLFEDLRQYKGGNVSSRFGSYLMVYGVAGGYRLIAGSEDSTGKPYRVDLESIWENGGSGIDIRYNDVDEFLRAHPSQDSITEGQAIEILNKWAASPASAFKSLGTDLEPGEACWVFNNESAAELGRRFAVGKRSGAVYIGRAQADGSMEWHKMSSDTNSDYYTSGLNIPSDEIYTQAELSDINERNPDIIFDTPPPASNPYLTLRTLDEAIWWYLETTESNKYLQGRHFAAAYRILDKEESSGQITVYAHVLCEWVNSDGEVVSGGAGLVSITFNINGGIYEYVKNVSYIKPDDYPEIPQKVKDAVADASYFPAMRAEVNQNIADYLKSVKPQRENIEAPDTNILDRVYLGMTDAEVYKLFGEPDFSASGVMWYGYDDIGVFDPGFNALGVIERISLTDIKTWSMHDLIKAAILQHYADDISNGEYPVGANAGAYPAEWHEIVSLEANANEFTVEGIAQYELYLPDGEYDVRRVKWDYANIKMTFTKNADYDYVLTSCEIDGGQWLMGMMPVLKCYNEAMYYFVGALPYDSRYSIGAGTAVVTNHAGGISGVSENGYFTIQYFPGATLSIEEYDGEHATWKPASWIIEYADPSKNITVGKNGMGEIPITEDLTGIFLVDENRYVMKFEKYVRVD